MDAELERGLDDFAETVLAQSAAVSLAVAVTDRDRTLAVRSYGPVDVATMFQIGSIGKSFTAIVTLQLVDEGLLDLHAPITDALPWFSVRGATTPITLHHLLTHSAGLIRGSELADDA
jgi:CubicO group peptidase (beta-lactamase class C family)